MTRSGKVKMVITMRALHVRRINMRLVRFMRKEQNVIMDVVDGVNKKNCQNWNQVDTSVQNKYRRRAYYNMYRLDKDSTKIQIENSQPQLNFGGYT